MALSTAAERSLQLVAELDSRLTRLRHNLREVQVGDAAAQNEAAPAATDRLAEASDSPHRGGSSTRSSARRALLLTEELYNSLEGLQKTLEPPPLGRLSDLETSSHATLPPSLLPASEEPDPVPEVPHSWADTATSEICRAVVDESHIFTPATCGGLHTLLPAPQQVGDWSLLYSSSRHGSSLDRMNRTCQDHGPTVLAVRDTSGGTFGGFISTNWPSVSQPSRWSGNGQSFLWAVDSSAVEPEVLKFGWTRRGNQFFWSAKDALGLGGGCEHGSYGLWLDQFLANGTTSRCDVFGNPALCDAAKAEHRRTFTPELVEVWQIQG
jgi:hypothetical protein